MSSTVWKRCPSLTKAVAAALFAASALTAQPHFEVASVKPCTQNETSPEGRKGDGGQSSPIRLHLTCQSAMSLIQWAYINFTADHFDPLASEPISGSPGWTESEYFVVDATASSPQTSGTLNGPMLRMLLQERFHLKVRTDKKLIPVYLLSAARATVNLPASKPGACIPADPPPPVEFGKPFPRLCGMSQLTAKGFDAFSVTMPQLCRLLSDSLDRKLIDNTNIKGIYDVHLNLVVRPADSSEDLATIRSELKKIGLSLTSGKSVQDTLVIEHIERPAAN